MACTINRDSIENAIRTRVSLAATKTGLFQIQTLDRLTSTGEDSEAEDFALADINSAFNYRVIERKDDFFQIHAPYELVNAISKSLNQKEERETVRHSFDHNDFTYDYLKQKAGLTDETPLDVVKEAANPSQIEKFLKDTPGLKVEFGTDYSYFDSNTNHINISLPEMNDISERTGMPLREVIAVYTQHELAHAGTMHQLKNPEVVKELSRVMDAVKKYNQARPFEDVLRSGYVNDSGLPYALTSMEEFVADAFSNPYFIDYLKDIKDDTDPESFWDKLINFFRNLFGFGDKDTAYDRVVNTINSARKDHDHSYTNSSEDNLVIYRGNPKSYVDAAYEYFTTSSISDNIKEIFKSLPSTMIALKGQMDRETNQEYRNKIQPLLDAWQTVKGEEKLLRTYMNMLETSMKIAADIKRDSFEAEAMPDGDTKIKRLYSIYLAAKGMNPVRETMDAIIRLAEQDKYGEGSKEFVKRLKEASQDINAAHQNFVNAVMPSLKSFFASLNLGSYTYAQKNQELQQLEDRLSKATTDKERELLAHKIKEKRDELLLIPSPQTFDKIFSGEYVDSSMIQAWTESAIMNSHPLNATVQSILMSLDIEVSQELIAEENDVQKARDEFLKGVDVKVLRNTDKVFEPIMDEAEWVESVEEDDKGNLVPKTFKRKMFLSSYDSKYLHQHWLMKAKKDFYWQKAAEARRKEDTDQYNKYWDLYEKAVREYEQFMRENSERKYRDEVYDMYALLDKEVDKEITLSDGSKKTVKTTLRKEKGDIFSEIDALERERDSSSHIENDRILEAIKLKYIELSELRSIYDKSGKEKTGFEKALSDIANEFYDLRSKYGQYILTPKGMELYEREKKRIEEDFSRGFITQEQKEARLSEITATEIDPDFRKAADELSEYIAMQTELMMGIPDLAPYLNVDKEVIKNGWAKIRKLSASFRDNNGVIDGVLFSKVRPELVHEIRTIQQEIENLNAQTAGLKSLSIQDTIRFNQLYAKHGDGTLTPEENTEYEALRNEKYKRAEIYSKHKTVIDAYYELLKKAGQLWESSASQYYVDAMDNEKSRLIQEEREKIREELKTSTSLETGKYYQKNDKWWEVEEVDAATGEKYVKEIAPTPEMTATEVVIDKVAKERVERDFKNSQWWKDNHITSYKFNVEEKSFVSVEVPIYIWVTRQPKDESFLKTVPAFKFKSYQIHDGVMDKSKSYLNPNHQEILPFIPVNKKGKFENKRYQDLSTSTSKKDMAYKKYLEFLRSKYQQYQQYHPESKAMGDLLPGIVKNFDERNVDLSNKMLRASTYRNLFGLGAGASSSEDTQILTGGSQSKIEEARRQTPVRFTEAVKAEEQSSDLTAMILSFGMAAKRYQKVNNIQPMLESLRTVVATLPVQEMASLSKEFTFKNLFAALKGERKTLMREKSVAKSNLSKTMDHILDTFLYEQRRNSATSDIMGMSLYWYKVAGGIKEISSRAAFIMNHFLAVKNTLAGTVQAVVNSNLSKGFYQATHLAKGKMKAAAYIKDSLSDYTKFGNKSQMGQALRYFQVLHGNAYDEYGRLTAWTIIKDKMNMLTLLKNVSEAELQISQFLAMSEANLVEVDGKMVPFLEAFHLDAKGNFTLKPNVKLTKEEIDAFTKRIAFVNRRINGAYREMERTMAQKTVLGDLAFYLNGWVMPGFTNRFGAKRYAVEADSIQKGYYRQAASFILELVKYRQGVKQTWEELTPDEKSRLMTFVKEISFVLSGVMLVPLLGGGDDKAELQKNTDFYNYMLGLAIAVKSETETFIPIPGMGLNEWVRKANSPFAALRQLTSLAKLLQHGLGYLSGSDDAFYKVRTYNDGFHDKGDPKVVAEFMKLLGWGGLQYSPVERVQNLQKMQIIR